MADETPKVVARAVKKAASPLVLSIDSRVHSVDLTSFVQYFTWSPSVQWFPMNPGENHHKLLALLSSQLPKGAVAVDLGTDIGASAASLAFNKDVRVTTIDIQDVIPGDPNLKTIKNVPNIYLVPGDCAEKVGDYTNASIIFLDIALHDGQLEKKVYDILVEKDFKGVLILDDIHLNDGMENLWNSIQQKKIDATAYGHHSGTGIVVFDPKTIDVEMS